MSSFKKCKKVNLSKNQLIIQKKNQTESVSFLIKKDTLRLDVKHGKKGCIICFMIEKTAFLSRYLLDGNNVLAPIYQALFSLRL